MAWIGWWLLGVTWASQDVAAAAWRAHQDAAALAAEAERRADPEAALAACAEAVAVLPDGPRAVWCAERAAFLEARRDPDGGLRGWQGLEAIRRSREDRQTQRQQLLAWVAGEGNGEVARREAFGWLADDALTRLRDPVEAARWSGPLATLSDLPDDERRRYRVLHARVLTALGRWDEAADVEADVLVAPMGLRLSPVEIASRDAFRLLAARGAHLLLAVFAALALVRGVRARPVGLGPGGWSLLVGWWGATTIAVAWETTNDALFATVGAGFAAVYALAWFGGSGSGGTRWFRGLSMFAAPAVVVAALAWHQRFEEIGW